jgi:ribosomal protein L12E/L44/L45/RPP1/RPP2
MNTITIWINRKKLALAVVVTLGLAGTLGAVDTPRADIYSWQDEEGTIHFSNQAAPPEAELYMREPLSPARVEQTEAANGQVSQQVDIEAVRRQVRNEIRLEEANRKLGDALNRIDELTENVSRSQAAAAAAGEVARQTAAAVATAAAAADDHRNYVREPVVILSTPYWMGHRKHGKRPHNADHFKSGGKKPTVQWRRHSKAGKSEGLWSPLPHQRRNRALSPQRSFIPKAYGIR